MFDDSQQRTELNHLLARVRSSKHKFFVSEGYVKTFGADGAIFLCFLINKLQYWADKDKLIDGKWFYCTVETISDRLGFSYAMQRKIVKKLEDLGVLQKRTIGLPPKRYFSLDLLLAEQLTGNTPKDAIFPTNSGNNVEFSQRNPECAPSSTFERDQTSRIEPAPSSRSLYKRSSTKKESSTYPRHETVPSGMVLNSRDSFLPGNTPTREDNTRHAQWATALREALRRNNIPVTNKRAVQSWAKEFRILESAAPTADIAAVLAWYTGNIGKEYTPVAICGKSFRMKYPKLKAAMDRDSRENPRVPLPPELTFLEKTLTADYKWPKGSAEWVGLALAVGHREYETFRTTAQSRVSDFPKTDSLRMFWENVIAPLLGSPASFLKRWMVEVYKDLANWKDWSGTKKDFLRRAFSVGSDKFQKWGRAQATRYNGSSAYWDKLMELTA